MKDLILVHGKAKNRTALGIANAYQKIYPNCTLEELNQAFPGTLNSSNRSETIFVDVNDAHKFTTKKEGNSTYEMFFFEKPEELIHLKNGQKVAMQELWKDEDFQKIVNHAKQYGIVVASFEDTKVMQRGEYRLEYLNGFLPLTGQIVEEKKKFPWLLLLLGMLLLGGVLYWLLAGKNKNNTEQNTIVTKSDTIVQIQHDTVVIANKELQNQANEISSAVPQAKIEKQGDDLKLVLNENSIKFDSGKFDLTDSAKQNIDKLFEIFNKNPENKITITGYTDSTGKSDSNLILSENRAKAVVDYLITKGLPENSLSYVGKGDREPIADNNTEEGKAQNRRVEFVIADK